MFWRSQSLERNRSNQRDAASRPSTERESWHWINARDYPTQQVEVMINYHQLALKLCTKEIVIAVTIADCVIYWWSFLPIAKMASQCGNAWCHGHQKEVQSLSHTPVSPSRGGHTNAIGEEVLADYDWDVGHKPEGSDLEIKTVIEEEENYDEKYVKMELPHDRTLCQGTMNHKVIEKIKQVHQTRGPEIMASWCQDMYIWLRFSPKAARLLIREQGLDSPERLRY